jgi:hypothetical protein
MYFWMICKMLFDYLVKLADTFPETDIAPIQGIDEAGQIAVIVAGTISVGKRIVSGL